MCNYIFYLECFNMIIDQRVMRMDKKVVWREKINDEIDQLNINENNREEVGKIQYLRMEYYIGRNVVYIIFFYFRYFFY